MNNSLSLICPWEHKDNINKLIEVLPGDRGPDNLSLMLSASGAAPATHTGCHTYDDELAAIIAGRVVPDGLDLASVSLTLQDAQDAIESVSIYSVPDNQGIVNIDTLAASLGLTRFTIPEEL